jgi:hypothetical protein
MPDQCTGRRRNGEGCEARGSEQDARLGQQRRRNRHAAGCDIAGVAGRFTGRRSAAGVVLGCPVGWIIERAVSLGRCDRVLSRQAIHHRGIIERPEWRTGKAAKSASDDRGKEAKAVQRREAGCGDHAESAGWQWQHSQFRLGLVQPFIAALVSIDDRGRLEKHSGNVRLWSCPPVDGAAADTLERFLTPLNWQRSRYSLILRMILSEKSATFRDHGLDRVRDIGNINGLVPTRQGPQHSIVNGAAGAVSAGNPIPEVTVTPNRDEIETLVDQIDNMIETIAKLELNTTLYLFQMARLDLVTKAARIPDATHLPAKRKPQR